MSGSRMRLPRIERSKRRRKGGKARQELTHRMETCRCCKLYPEQHRGGTYGRPGRPVEVA